MIKIPGRYHLLAGGHSGNTYWDVYINGVKATGGNNGSANVYVNLNKNDTLYFLATHPSAVVGFGAAIILDP